MKTGIIGCGKVAHLHAAGLVNLEESEFTAVCDLDRGRVEAFAAQYGVTAYTDVAAMVEESGIEMLTVATPHPVHALPAVVALEAGANVLIEKPLASTLEDCDTMIAASKRTGRKIGMISQRRLYEPVLRVKQAIAAGKLGTPILGTLSMLGWRDEPYYRSDPWRGTWRSEGGGVLVNQAPHQLDILQWYMGEIDELSGYWANLNHPYIEVEDTAAAVIKFRSGGLGVICVSNSQNPALHGKVHVHGSNGASAGVQTDGGSMFIAGMTGITEPPYNDVWTVPGEEQMLDVWKTEIAERFLKVDATTHYHELMIADFIDAIASDRAPLITAESGRVTVEIFTAIYRSNRDRGPVTFPLQPEPDPATMDGRVTAAGT